MSMAHRRLVLVCPSVIVIALLIQARLDARDFTYHRYQTSWVVSEGENVYPVRASLRPTFGGIGDRNSVAGQRYQSPGEYDVSIQSEFRRTAAGAEIYSSIQANTAPGFSAAVGGRSSLGGRLLLVTNGEVLPRRLPISLQYALESTVDLERTRFSVGAGSAWYDFAPAGIMEYSDAIRGGATSQPFDVSVLPDGRTRISANLDAEITALRVPHEGPGVYEARTGISLQLAGQIAGGEELLESTARVILQSIEIPSLGGATLEELGWKILFPKPPSHDNLPESHALAIWIVAGAAALCFIPSRAKRKSMAA